MAYFGRQVGKKFFGFVPIFLLFFIALNGNSIIDLKLFSINIHYIIVYYWVLKDPETFGYGLIFLSGIISDVIFGFPFGVNALSLLVIAALATYVRIVTVRVTLLNDWIAFIPALLIANLIYFFSLFFSDYAIDYFHLFVNSIFTFIFYPVLWIIFLIYLRLVRS
jgi:cell shape-determining protein MreD